MALTATAWATDPDGRRPAKKGNHRIPRSYNTTKHIVSLTGHLAGDKDHWLRGAAVPERPHGLGRPRRQHSGMSLFAPWELWWQQQLRDQRAAAHLRARRWHGCWHVRGLQWHKGVCWRPGRRVRGMPSRPGAKQQLHGLRCHRCVEPWGKQPVLCGGPDGAAPQISTRLHIASLAGRAVATVGRLVTAVALRPPPAPLLQPRAPALPALALSAAPARCAPATARAPAATPVWRCAHRAQRARWPTPTRRRAQLLVGIAAAKAGRLLAGNSQTSHRPFFGAFPVRLSTLCPLVFRPFPAFPTCRSRHHVPCGHCCQRQQLHRLRRQHDQPRRQLDHGSVHCVLGRLVGQCQQDGLRSSQPAAVVRLGLRPDHLRRRERNAALHHGRARRDHARRWAGVAGRAVAQAAY